MYKLLGTSQSILKRNIPKYHSLKTIRLLQTTVATHSKNKTATIVNERIHKAGRRHMLKIVTSEFAKVKDTRLPLSESSYEHILDAYIKLRKPNQLLTPIFEAYNTFLAQGGHPSPKMYAMMIHVLSQRDGEVRNTVRMFERQLARTGETSLIPIMEALTSEDNINRAITLFREAVELNGADQLDIRLCNQLLSALSHNSFVNDALFVFEYMENTRGVDARSFASMVTLFGSMGNLRAANEYFEKYMRRKHKLRENHNEFIVHHALVNAYVNVGDIQGALDIAQRRMVEDGVRISVNSYNRIIRGAFLFEQVDVANGLFMRFCSNDNSLPKPVASTFGLFLSNYAALGEFEKAKEAYQLLKKLDLKEQYGHLANYIHACTEKNRVDEALDAVLTLTRAGFILEYPTSRRFLMTCAENKENIDAAMILQKVMNEYARHRFIDSKSPIVSLGFELAESFNDDIIPVLHILRTLKNYGVFPNADMSNSLLDRYMHAKSDEAQWNDLSSKLDARNFATLFETAFQRESTPSELCQTMLDILQDMEELNINPPPEWYVRISTRMMKYDEFEEYWKERFLSYFPAANLFIKNPVDRDIKEEKQDDTLNQALRNENGEKIKPTDSELLSEEALNAALGGRLNRAIDIIDLKIVQQDKIPTPDVVRDIILLSKNRLDVAERVYGIVSKPLIENPKDNAYALSTLYNSMLKVYAQNGHLTSAKQYYQKLQKGNLQLDGETLASLMTCLSKNENKEEDKEDELDPYTIYQNARNQKVILPTYFYNVLLSHLSNNHKLEETLTTFDEMKQSNVIPNTVTFASIISACLRIGSENHASHYFQEMIASPKYQPRIGVYNQMMQFYLQQKSDREKALEYYNLSKHHHVQPTAHTFRLLIEAHATLPPYDMWESRKLLDSMRNEFDIKPTGIHYSMLIYSYGCLQNDVQAALDIYNDMLMKHTIKDGIASYRMLETFFQNNMEDRAYTLYDKITLKNKSTNHIENVFIEKYGAKGDVASAEAIFYKLKDKQENDDDLVKNEDSYKAMVNVYVNHKQYQQAREMIESMRRNRMSSELTDALEQTCNK